MAGGEERASDFVVLAAGARNQLLPETTALALADLEMTLGYFVPDRRRHHQGEIPEAVRGISVVLSARRSSFGGNLREDGAEFEPATAAASR